METTITLLLQKRAGTLARVVASLQTLNLKCQRYLDQREQSSGELRKVTLSTAGGSVSPEKIGAVLQSVDGVVAVVGIVNEPMDARQGKLKTRNAGPETEKDANPGPPLDGYFFQQFQGLQELIRQLQGENRLKTMLAEVNDTVSKYEWPVQDAASGKTSTPDVDTGRYRAVFERALNCSEALVGRAKVAEQLRAVELRCQESGEHVADLSRLLGVTQFLDDSAR